MPLSPNDMECLQSAKAFIDADLMRHHTIPQIALHVGTNSAKLRAGFKELFGTGLYQYLKEQRLQHGKYLLENTYDPIKKISRLLGYKHLCNFITAYKKRFGKSPGSWRNGMLLWILMLPYVQGYFAG